MSGWSLMTIRWAWSRRRTSWSCREAETGTSPTCWSMGRGVSKSWKKSRNNNTHTHVFFTAISEHCLRKMCNKPRCLSNPTSRHVSVVSAGAASDSEAAAMCICVLVLDFFFFTFFKVVVSPSCPSHNLQIVTVILGWLMEEMRFRKVNIS